MATDYWRRNCSLVGLLMGKNIRYLVMDVDGTLTNGKIYIGSEGEIFKAFNVKDGIAIHGMLPELKIVPIVITGRTSKIVTLRCEELGIQEIHQGVSDKLLVLDELLADWGGQLENVAYIGDDLNDLKCMESILAAGGILACPADASIEVREICHFVSSKKGGEGAVRDCIEWIKATFAE